MALCLKSSNDCGIPSCSGVACVDCACDAEKVRLVRAHLEEQFPDHTVSDFHSRSTVKHGGVVAPCAEHHVVSVNDERPYCAVLTRAFLEHAVEDLAVCLRQWDLAGTLRAERVVILQENGLSPL